MKEEIARWKKTNGNATFTMKDMLIWNTQKLEKLDDKLDKHIEGIQKQFGSQIKDCNKTFVTQRVATGGFTLLLMLIGALAGYVLL